MINQNKDIFIIQYKTTTKKKLSSNDPYLKYKTTEIEETQSH